MSGAGLVLLGRDQVVLGPTDGRSNSLSSIQRGVDAALFERAFEGLAAIGGIVDREVFGQPDQRGILPQEPHKAVERAHPHRLARGELFDARPHFIGGLVRKRQRQNLPGGHAMAQQIGDAVRNDPRLAAAGPGENEQRPFQVLDGLTLGRRQRIELLAPQNTGSS